MLIILLLVCLIVLNGLFAMSEIAVVSSRKIRLEQAAERGSRGAMVALKLAASPTRFFSTVQIGITLIGIVAGAFSEATISNDLARWLGQFPALAAYSSMLATAIVVLALTYLSLVFGELVPKRLAVQAPERIASLIAPPMQWLSRLAAPAVHLLTFSTDLILKVFGIRAVDEQAITERDIRDLVEQGAASGVFLEQERELVERIFRLGDYRVSALMVPRREIVWLEADAPTDRVRVAVAASSHSHYPVCRGGLDALIGVVHLKDMVKSGLLSQTPIHLTAIARQPLYVPESMPVLRLIDAFRREKMHIAFVLDEYGVVTGLITLNDIVESMLGQIAREGEAEELMAVQRPDGSWLLDASMPIGELKALLDIETMPGESRASFHTLAGFLLSHLGRIPQVGERIAFDQFSFEIIDMDRHRIDKVLLTITPPSSPPSSLPQEHDNDNDNNADNTDDAHKSTNE